MASYSATDQDEDEIVWSLGGDDADSFSISEEGVLSLDDAPNYELEDTYNVTVKATGGTLDVTVKIANVNELGTASLNKPQPQAGRGLMASVSDVDSDPEDVEWQWTRSMDGETGWMDIDGATSPSRSPVAADVGYYLRATVTYTGYVWRGPNGLGSVGE